MIRVKMRLDVSNIKATRWVRCSRGSDAHAGSYWQPRQSIDWAFAPLFTLHVTFELGGLYFEGKVLVICLNALRVLLVILFIIVCVYSFAIEYFHCCLDRPL